LCFYCVTLFLCRVLSDYNNVIIQSNTGVPGVVALGVSPESGLTAGPGGPRKTQDSKKLPKNGKNTGNNVLTLQVNTVHSSGGGAAVTTLQLLCTPVVIIIIVHLSSRIVR
jgi:hypothetical protein